MKQLVTLLLGLLPCLLWGQAHSSDELALILWIQNQNGQNYANQEVNISNVNNGAENHKAFTKKNGKVRFVLRRGETYHISFLDAKNHSQVTIPKTGMSFMTKKLIYKGKSTLNAPIKLDTIVQKITRKTKATRNEVLFTLIVKDKRGVPIPNINLWFVQSQIKKAYKGKTNRQGAVKLLLPNGYDYHLNFEKDANYRKITVPKMPYLVQRKGISYTSNAMTISEIERNDTIFQKVPLTQKPTRHRILMQVTVLDLDNKPLENEKVFMIAPNKVYTATTGKDGKTALMIPKNQAYAISFEYSDSLEVINYKKGNYVRRDKVRYKYIGSAAIKAREAQRARIAAMADSLNRIRAFRDSLAKERSKFSGFADKINDGISDEAFKQLVQKRADQDREKLAADPKYFEKIGDDVAAAFYRNRKKWKRKIIVNDLTCSMYRHLDQVIVWHILDQHKAKENQYIFFNDGNGKSLAEKITGQTGGFHYTNKTTLNDLKWTMLETMKTGCSGDSPENDMEALLESLKYRTGYDEVILIADNCSDVRDIALLKQLNVPVRIILAGTHFGINEQYLEIAYHTKGSIHTLEEDVTRLYNLNDGEHIKIGGNNYRVSRGKFLMVKQM